MPAERMPNADWQETDDFHRMLQHVGATRPTPSQRRIACEFARLVFDDLPLLGKTALEYAENMDSDSDHPVRSKQFQDQLQMYLSKDHSSVACSAVIWALMPWAWVWSGDPKWSVFPYDVAYVLHRLFGWFAVPPDPALWPFVP